MAGRQIICVIGKGREACTVMSKWMTCYGPVRVPISEVTDRIAACEVGALERFTKCFESGQVQAADQDTPTTSPVVRTTRSFTTRHHAYARLLVFDPLLRHNAHALRPVGAHAEQRERRPGIESVPTLIVGYRAGRACRARSRQ